MELGAQDALAKTPSWTVSTIPCFCRKNSGRILPIWHQQQEIAEKVV
ncbi:MAG TPA: hypothetical protein O0W91_04990 [Methanocorpusculum sp.]|nr:hypothetical protein [Methanocorpusculum sp.]